MLDRKLHTFYLSFKVDGDVKLEWVEGINLRHAKDKIELKYEQATDIMDWTHERKEDLQIYLNKIESSHEIPRGENAEAKKNLSK